MCYLVLLGTDAEEDLAQHDAGEVRFSRILPDQPEGKWLALPRRWTVSAAECSCGFRHVMHPTADWGFSEPVDWYQENDENIIATRHVIRVIRTLVAGGAQVECVDLWTGSMEGTPTTIEVDLAAVSDSEFRFFENHRFVFLHVNPSRKPHMNKSVKR